ncbi:MAG: G/T mismatches repair enzyme [Candidatus Diapherotrites archaeon ADurb.Bin253]|jgi:endonuclease-3|nr:MAG: G/T mismatches repair enzyme [Candidatus Diapherotrites archaeon ADurb.Bin253]HNZ52242.1 endonuclease III [Candidatus Pacearchaeota archaeon]HOC96799.1 endonuclease III [Candidatus Pacearchaeota archaeon]HOF43936.1 endonuclease III [Candidatus Pacearchaeota archaeon]HOH04235.1 endonuclease III [Candidatus Pacearchaeota archaeon]
MQEAYFKEIMEELKRLYPSTDKTTLNRMRTKPDPFKVLISCLLSLRARDENTEKVSKKLFEVVNTPEQLVKIPIPKLEKIIFSSGHYKKKARVLHSVSNELITRFNSKVPDKKDELLSIKGIGPKTANIVLAFAFNKPVIPVDTHVHRIPNRLGWVQTKKPEQTEQELMKILPKIYWADVNAIFVQFGRDICQPVSPKCSTCPINKYCKKRGIIRSR